MTVRAPMASGGSKKASARAAASPASEARGSKPKASARSAAPKKGAVRVVPVGGASPGAGEARAASAVDDSEPVTAVSERATVEALMSLKEVLSSLGSVKPREGELRVLYLGPFVLGEELNASARAWEKRLAADLGYKVALVVGDSTFSEIDLAGNAWWFRPVARKYEDQVKKMRTQGLAALVHLLGLVSKHRPRVVVGMPQGGAVVALAGFPLLLETACRLRATPHTELAEFRRGWAGVQALVVVNPSVMPSPHFTDIEFLGQAFPEIYRVQPRGVLRKVIIEGRYIHERFAHALGGALGAVPGQWQEAEKQALSAKPC